MANRIAVLGVMMLMAAIASGCMSERPEETGLVPIRTEAEYARYQEQIADTQTHGLGIARKMGKEELVRRYRAVIAAHPGYDRNLYLETRIAQVYKWDMPERQEPSDPAKALGVYVSAIQRYKANGPFMKQTLFQAAETSADLKPELSDAYYKQILAQYPDDDVSRLRCYWGMGLLADKSRDWKQAEQYHAAVLSYKPPVTDKPSKAFSDIQRYRANAAIGIFWAAFGSSDSDAGKLQAIERVLQKYPQIEMWHFESVDRMRHDLAESVARRASQDNPSAVPGKGELPKAPKTPQELSAFLDEL